MDRLEILIINMVKRLIVLLSKEMGDTIGAISSQVNARGKERKRRKKGLMFS